MNRSGQIVAFALGVHILFFTQTSSAQVINRLKERRGKEQESTARHVVPASHEADASPAADRNRLKPTPMAVAPPASRSNISNVKVSDAKAEQVSSLGVIPRIAVETSGPSQVNLGRRARYTITVRNDGDATAHGIVLQATVPSGAELVETAPQPDLSHGHLEYRLGDLTPKATTSIQVDLIPRQHGPMDFKTVASISITSTASFRVRKPELIVKFSGPADAVLGDVVKFKATITNTGDGPIEDVAISQLLPKSSGDGDVVLTDGATEQVQSRIERLQPGQSEEIELPALATGAGLMRANILIKAADGVEAQAAAEVHVRRPAIAIKTIGPETRPVQRSGGYVILVSNSGDAPADNIVITANVPKGLEVIGIEKRTTFDKSMNTLTWNLAQIGAGATESLKFQVKAIEEGEQKIEVVAVGERKLTVDTAHVIRVAGKADLTLTVDDSPGPIEVGGVATYDIRVKNSGTKIAQKVRVSCSIPRGLAIEPSSDYSINGSTLDFNAIDSLAVGEEIVLQLTATGREAGDQSIRFTLHCDILPREISTETSTFFFQK